MIVARFQAEKLSDARRADLHAYMNRLLIKHPAANEYGLNRDPTRWGIVKEEPPPNPSLLIYVLRPPWVANDLVSSHRMLTGRPSITRPGSASAHASGK